MTNNSMGNNSSMHGFQFFIGGIMKIHLLSVALCSSIRNALEKYKGTFGGMISYACLCCCVVLHAGQSFGAGFGECNALPRSLSFCIDDDPICAQCKPCDEFKLDCEIKTLGDDWGQMNSELCDGKVVCTIGLSTDTCTELSLTSGKINPAELKERVMDPSSYPNANPDTICGLAHEIDHAMSMCGKSCNTEMHAMKTELGCLTRRMEKQCVFDAGASEVSANFRTCTEERLKQGNPQDFYFIGAGAHCAYLKSLVRDISLQMSWLERRCTGGAINCDSESDSHSQYCYGYSSSAPDDTIYSSKSQKEVCEDMKRTYEETIAGQGDGSIGNHF